MYSVAPNPSSAARTGQITVAGATFSVNQAGSGAGTSITINNPGFETLPSNPQWIDCSGYAGPGCRYTGDGNVPGWTASGAGPDSFSRNESRVGYSLAGCSPAEPASALPAGIHVASAGRNSQPPLAGGWGVFDRRFGDFSTGVDSFPLAPAA
jgi:hypothetical protein